MNWNDHKKIRIAILDLYDGHANQGMRCIREIINQFGESNSLNIDWDEFDVRQRCEVPDLNYDVYISSGGPGSPLESEGSDWEKAYFGWLSSLENWNNNPAHLQKKQAFFICHSFQLVCRHYNIARVCKRISTAFGVFPVHMMEAGYTEPIFEGLNNPFYTVDSRDYQVINPNYQVIEHMGAQLLCLEKERPHVPYERAIMAIRFNEHFIGTQFHPEADAIGMSMYLQTEERKQIVIEHHGIEKWSDMVEQLGDPDKILNTYSHILPNFLNMAIGIPVEA